MGILTWIADFFNRCWRFPYNQLSCTRNMQHFSGHSAIERLSKANPFGMESKHTHTHLKELLEFVPSHL